MHIHYREYISLMAWRWISLYSLVWTGWHQLEPTLSKFVIQPIVIENDDGQIIEVGALHTKDLVNPLTVITTAISYWSIGTVVAIADIKLPTKTSYKLRQLINDDRSRAKLGPAKKRYLDEWHQEEINNKPYIHLEGLCAGTLQQVKGKSSELKSRLRDYKEARAEEESWWLKTMHPRELKKARVAKEIRKMNFDPICTSPRHPEV